MKQCTAVLISLLVLRILPATAQSWDYTVYDAAIFSSPKASDLNEDGYPDIVIGTGNEDKTASEGVLAIDGRTGQQLWAYEASNQVYGTAIFEDINADGTAEVFIGGRKGFFVCLNGKDGKRIWQFDPGHFGHVINRTAYNLYTPSWVPDQNNDGVPELVNVYGGGTVQSGNNRPSGWLLLISGKTGEILAADSMPDGRESYSSPLAHDFDDDGELEVIFGTGEERRGGSLWRCTLDQLKSNDISASNVLATDSLKGFIAVSSMADFNGDDILDIACPALNEKLLVIDGENGETIFEYREPGFEQYTTPVIGNFTGDITLDIFCIFQEGLWPFYRSYKLVLIDGATGLLAWEKSFQYYQLSQYVAFDCDGDNYDELIFCHNTDTGFFTIEYTHQVQYIDFQDDSISDLLPVRGGLNIFSSPLLGDFDQDGMVEITYAHALNSNKHYSVDSSRIHLQELLFPHARSIAWGGYLGNYSDGIFRRKALVPSAITYTHQSAMASVYPNPGNGKYAIRTPFINYTWELFDALGRKIAEGSQNTLAIERQGGRYWLRISNGKEAMHIAIAHRPNAIP